MLRKLKKHFRWLRLLPHNVYRLMRMEDDLLAVQQERLRREILQSERYQDPRRLARYEWQCFSQPRSDGILVEIFRRIGTTDKVFVEIGSGRGLENSTAYFLTCGWRGTWFDGNPDEIAVATEAFAPALAEKRLTIKQAFITRENIAALLREQNVPETFDLLTLDIDRNTSYIFEALGDYKPRVMMVEYNGSFPPDQNWRVKYDPKKVWNDTNYYGGSLKNLEEIGSGLGYHLVGCDLSGNDCFFVRKDLTADLFCAPFTAENHYEEPRFYLLRKVGHPACFSD